MPYDIDAVLQPDRTAVVFMELQRGIVGDLADLPHLVNVLQARDTLGAAARLAEGARANGVRVIFSTLAHRPDGAGSSPNAPMLARLLRPGAISMVQGTPATEIVPELGLTEADIVVSRLHGMGPFTGTELDSVLRGLGVSTVVAAGVSLNVGVVAMTIEAVGLGYQVVVATDAVAGVPGEYGDSIIAGTLRLLGATLPTPEIVSVWERASKAS
jgi:nicotinamidase-related amidase